MGCHLKHHNADPQIYENFVVNKPAEWYEHIKRQRNVIVKPTLAWYKKQIEKL